MVGIEGRALAKAINPQVRGSHGCTLSRGKQASRCSVDNSQRPHFKNVYFGFSKVEGYECPLPSSTLKIGFSLGAHEWCSVLMF